MSTVKPTAKQIAAIEDILNDDHPTVTAAARAVWDAMHDEIIGRGKWVVAAQLVGTKERPRIPASDPESIKVALSLFATAGDAQKAAESLVLQPATGDRYLCWTIPVVGMTAAEFTKQRREQLTAAEAKREDKLRENLRAQIEKRTLQAEELAGNMRGDEEAA